MTKHFCDICGKEQDWRHMVRIHADREGVSCVISPMICNYELCSDCFERAVKPIEPAKKEYEFPPQTVEAISGVSPV